MIHKILTVRFSNFMHHNKKTMWFINWGIFTILVTSHLSSKKLPLPARGQRAYKTHYNFQTISNKNGHCVGLWALPVHLNSWEGNAWIGLSFKWGGKAHLGPPAVKPLVLSQSANQAMWQLQLKGLAIRLRDCSETEKEKIKLHVYPNFFVISSIL